MTVAGRLQRLTFALLLVAQALPAEAQQPGGGRRARTMYEDLAGAFATERLRQLAMMQPSAPVTLADFEARAS